MLTDLQVEEIRTREEKATEGPWTYEDDHEGSSMGWISGKRSRNQYKSELFRVLGDGAEEYETADFVVHSRTDIPALLADRDELIEMLKEATRILSPLLTAIDSPFVSLTYRANRASLLELCPEIVTWADGGRAFLIRPEVQELVK